MTLHTSSLTRHEHTCGRIVSTGTTDFLHGMEEHVRNLEQVCNNRAACPDQARACGSVHVLISGADFAQVAKDTRHSQSALLQQLLELEQGAQRSNDTAFGLCAC